MKFISIKDLSENLARKTQLNRKIADDVVELIVLDIRDTIAEGDYKKVRGGKERVHAKTQRSKKTVVPLIEANKEELAGMLSKGTVLGKRAARKAVKIIKNNILAETIENKEIKVEELGLFRNESPEGVTPRLSFEPIQPEKIEFPELKF